MSLPLPFCRVDLSRRCVFNDLLLKKGVNRILSQVHLNTSTTKEISLIVRVIFPSGSTFPARIIGRILTEGLIPYDIHLSTTSRQGYFRVIFKNEYVLRHFFIHLFFPQPVVFQAPILDPVQIQFSFESIPCNCCDEGLAKCLTTSLKNLGVIVTPISQTSIFTMSFPSPDCLFAAFLGLFQKLGVPLSL